MKTHKITQDDVEQTLMSARIDIASSVGNEEQKVLTYHLLSKVYTVKINNKEVLNTLFVDKAVRAYNRETIDVESIGN